MVKITKANVKECKRRRQLCIKTIHAPGGLYVSQVVKKRCEIRQACRKNEPAIYLFESRLYVSEKS